MSLPSIESINEFYTTFYEKFQIESGKVKREKDIRIFSKLPLFPKSLSIRWSWAVYAVLYLIFKPFQLIDKAFFLKTEFFNNNSNGTSLFLKAIWSSALVLLIYKTAKEYNTEIDAKEFAVAIGVISALYWKARNVFSRKWDYSADMYNKLSFDLPFAEYKDIKDKRICYHFHQVTIASDLLLLETWSHSSFIYTFREALELAIAYDSFKSKRAGGQVINHNETLDEIRTKIEDLYNGKAIIYSEMAKVFECIQCDLTEYCVNTNFKKSE